MALAARCGRTRANKIGKCIFSRKMSLERLCNKKINTNNRSGGYVEQAAEARLNVRGGAGLREDEEEGGAHAGERHSIDRRDDDDDRRAAASNVEQVYIF